MKRIVPTLTCGAVALAAASTPAMARGQTVTQLLPHNVTMESVVYPRATSRI